MKTSNKVILLLGGNIGNTQKFLSQAIRLLSIKLGTPTKQSYLYESEPWGFDASQNFINQVVEFQTEIEPLTLLDFTQKTELELGRQKKAGTHYESRPIDIDILFIDDLCYASDRLTIPHMLIQERMFTLRPLSDYWGDFIHPKLNKSIHQLITDCPDQSVVRRVD